MHHFSFDYTDQKMCLVLDYKTDGAENEMANVLVAVTVNVSYGVFATTKLVGLRSSTICCMIALGILLQHNMAYQIVKMHKKVSSDGNEKFDLEKRKAFLRLVLAELCEGLVHMAYIIGFAIAFYGPNSKLIGNVGFGCWHFKAVVDESWNFLVMFGLFCMDLVSLLLNATIIWKTSHANIFQEFCYVLQKYWPILGLKLTHFMYYHFISNDVNFAMDRTLEYSWLTSNVNRSLMSNTTDIC